MASSSALSSPLATHGSMAGYIRAGFGSEPTIEIDVPEPEPSLFPATQPQPEPAQVPITPERVPVPA